MSNKRSVVKNSVKYAAAMVFVFLSPMNFCRCLRNSSNVYLIQLVLFFVLFEFELISMQMTVLNYTELLCCSDYLALFYVLLYFLGIKELWFAIIT